MSGLVLCTLCRGLGRLAVTRHAVRLTDVVIPGSPRLRNRGIAVIVHMDCPVCRSSGWAKWRPVPPRARVHMALRKRPWDGLRLFPRR